MSRYTLWATPSLAWLTAHDETVAVLGNLRILAWVVKAGAALGSNACVARFSNFLTTPFGAPLRLDGLRWIAAAFSEGPRISRWYRDRTRDVLIELLNTAINQNGRELRGDASARQALFEIAGELARNNVPAALALQERIKNLR